MRPTAVLLPLAFAAFGVMWGGWQAVLPDLAGHFALETGALGAILTIGFVAALPTMILAGRLVDRLGAGWGIAIPASVMAAGLLAVGSLASIPVLVLGVVAISAGSGAFDVAINGAAMGDPGWSRAARMTLLHAAFSAGAAVGALAAGAAVAAGLPFQATYFAIGVVLVLVGGAVAAAPWRRVAAADVIGGGVVRALVPLAVLAALAFLAEGSMETWSAIYLRDELGAAAFVGALGPASFHLAMLAGRLGGAGVAGLLGPSRTLLVSGGLTALGMAVALTSAGPATAIPGLAVAALGASFAVPVIVSLAAGRAGPSAGRAASYVLTLGYGGFLIGPSLVGLGAEAVGLRAALIVVPVAAVVIAAASPTRLTRP